MNHQEGCSKRIRIAEPNGPLSEGRCECSSRQFPNSEEMVMGRWNRLEAMRRQTRAPRAHGTKSAYSTGCRCEPCTKANRDYQRRYAARTAG
jgi:hypothetical protein